MSSNDDGANVRATLKSPTFVFFNIKFVITLKAFETLLCEIMIIFFACFFFIVYTRCWWCIYDIAAQEGSFIGTIKKYRVHKYECKHIGWL